MGQSPRWYWLYRIYDKDMVLLYIGRTCSPKTRIAHHEKKQPWWKEVDTIIFGEKVLGVRTICIAERNAVMNEKPVYNKYLTTGA